MRVCALLGLSLFSFLGQIAQGSQFFSVDVDTDELVRIDMPSGHVTVIGSLGFDTGRGINMTLLDGRLYAVTSVFGQSVHLHELDPLTGMSISSVPVQTTSGPVLAAEGLSQVGGQLKISFDNDVNFSSESLGDLGFDGMVSDFDSGDFDIDGLGVDTLTNQLYGIDANTSAIMTDVFTISESPLMISTFATVPEVLTNIAIRGDNLFGIDVFEPELYSLDLVTNTFFSTLLDRPGEYKGLASTDITHASDFNFDCLLDIDDLNAMLLEGPITGGVTVTPGVNDQFDLTGDGVIDLDDRDVWLADAASINGFGSSYKVGDANLDGVVDGQDFILWNASKFTSTLLWDSGNFNGDSVTDGQDFILWNGNKFTSSDGVNAVPEPGMSVFLIVVLISLAVVRRR